MSGHRRSSPHPGDGGPSPPPGAGAARPCDLLLTGGTVITVDDRRRVLDPGAVAVAGERIVAVGDPADLAALRPARVIDCRGRAVLPGLVSAHDHLWHGLGRGLGEGVPLWRWLSEVLWPYAVAMSAEHARAAAALGAVEAARAGITALLDHHYAPADPEATLEVASAIEEVGLRGVVVRGMFGPPTPMARRLLLREDLFTRSVEEEVEASRRCVEARPPGSAVRVWPGPNNVVYADQGLVRRTAALARELGVRWHGHCSEARTDPGLYREVFGRPPVGWLRDQGLLGPEATLAHAIWLDGEEVRALGDAGAGVAHAPISSQFLSMGVARLRDLRAAGAVVALGTDGSMCNNRRDMFEVMKQAVLLQRVHTLDPEACTAEEALEMATRDGARFLGTDAGVLAPGRLADLTVVDLDRPHLRPLHRAVATLVYSARASDVVMTVVGGRVVYEDGRVTTVREGEVLDRAEALAEELLARTGLAGAQGRSGRPAPTPRADLPGPDRPIDSELQQNVRFARGDRARRERGLTDA